MENQTSVSLLGATELLSQSWVIYKKQFREFIKIMVLPIFASLVFTFLISKGGLLDMSAISSQVKTGNMHLSGLLSTFILFLVVWLIYFVISSWGKIALLFGVKDSIEKSDVKINVSEVYKISKSKILSYFWILILTDLIIAGGFILLIVPGIIFAVWFSLSTFVFIAEDLKGMDALSKSKSYVKGRWGDVFIKFLFIGLISILVGIITNIIFSPLHLASTGNILGNFIGQIPSIFIGLILTPLINTYIFLLYKNLKATTVEIVSTN